MTSLAGLTTQVFGAILPFANFNVATLLNIYEEFFGGHILGQHFQMCFSFFRRVAIWNDHRCGDDALEERGKVTFVDNTDLTLGP